MIRNIYSFSCVQGKNSYRERTLCLHYTGKFGTYILWNIKLYIINNTNKINI